MPLAPIDERHAAQILAGTDGRLFGHRFEERLAAEINLLGQQPFQPTDVQTHLVEGIPAVELLAYVCRDLGFRAIDRAEAWWVGGLATAGKGDRSVPNTDLLFKRSKSDVVVRVTTRRTVATIGVGIKTCNNKTPTNAQLFFTTASAFCDLLRRQGLSIPGEAESAMKMFCGDPGYRPVDAGCGGRLADVNRWFWEELPAAARKFWEELLSHQQDEVTRSLLQFAYADDPLPPSYLLHQRSKAPTESRTPMALFSVDEFVALSRAAGGFSTRPYMVRKGTFKNDPATHLAPRFGFVQFQRGGQRQHPTQLQFNLQAGYFYKIS